MFNLLVNPGFQIHLTEFSWQTTSTPSNFVAKLRKEISNNRLLRIALAKNDRILVFEFLNSYVVFEFFSGGNLLLLNKDFRIVALQKRVNLPTSFSQDTKDKPSKSKKKGNATAEEQDTGSKDTQSRFLTENYSVGNVYDISKILAENEDASKEDDTSVSEEDVKLFVEGFKKQPEEEEASEVTAKKKKKNKAVPLKSALYIKYNQLSSFLFEKCLADSGIDPNQTVESIDLESDTQLLSKLTSAINTAFELAQKIHHTDPVEGYIIAKKNPDFKGVSTIPDDQVVVDPVSMTENGGLVDIQNIEVVYSDFQPFEPVDVPGAKNHGNFKLVKLETYNRTVDIFYSTIEAARLSYKTVQQEKVAEKRLAAAREEKDKRLRGLTEIQEKNNLCGKALEHSSHLVQNAINAVKELVDKKMDWFDIETFIQVEKRKNNPIAKVIALPLNLKENKITLILPNPNEVEEDSDSESSDSDSDSDSDDSDSDNDSDSDSDDDRKKKAKKQTFRPLKVAVDLALSPWANARSYYEIKREAVAKGERTLQNAEKALQSAEKKILRDLQHARAKNQNTQQGGGMRSIRKTFWFEKFNWFVSSDGYLVLGGRDDLQNNLLFRRYFKRNDLLVHCDQQGASLVVIKNHYKTMEFPPSTLSQAGAFTVASSSSAWDKNNLSASAWSARFEQVDKISPQGEPIDVSHLYVKGEKSIIRPSNMDMGFGFMFVLDDDSYKKRLDELPAQLKDVINNSGPIETEDNEDEEKKGDHEKNKEESSDSDSDLDSDSDDEDLFANVKIDKAVLKGKARGEDVKKEINEESESESESDPEPKSKPEPEPESDPKAVSEEKDEPEDSDTDDVYHSSEETHATKFDDISQVEKDLERLGIGSSGRKASKKAISSSVSSVSVSGFSTPGAAGSVNVAKLARGKKGKLKKLKGKYAAQDDDDRQKALEKIGTFKGIQREQLAEREARERQREQEAKKKERLKRQREAELLKILAEDEAGGDSASANNSAQIYPFGLVVPTLQRDETPIAAVPIFGPWQALQKVKLKIKLQPGGIKKGKAVRDILHSLAHAKVDSTSQDPSFPWPSEINLVKGIKETEAMLPICVSKVKYVLPSSGTGGKGGSSQKDGSKAKGNGGQKKGGSGGGKSKKKK